MGQISRSKKPPKRLGDLWVCKGSEFGGEVAVENLKRVLEKLPMPVDGEGNRRV